MSFKHFPFFEKKKKKSLERNVSRFLKELNLKNFEELEARNDVIGNTNEGKGSKRSVVILKISASNDTKKKIQVIFDDDERLPSKEVIFFFFFFLLPFSQKHFFTFEFEKKKKVITSGILLCY